MPTQQREVEEGQKCRLSTGRWGRDNSANSADGGGGGKKVLTRQRELEEGQKC